MHSVSFYEFYFNSYFQSQFSNNKNIQIHTFHKLQELFFTWLVNRKSWAKNVQIGTLFTPCSIICVNFLIRWVCDLIAKKKQNTKKLGPPKVFTPHASMSNWSALGSNIVLVLYIYVYFNSHLWFYKHFW